MLFDFKTIAQGVIYWLGSNIYTTGQELVQSLLLILISNQ